MPCTDTSPCWEFSGELTRASLFPQVNDYLIWLIVLSIVAALLLVCVIFLIIFLCSQRKKHEDHEDRLQALEQGAPMAAPMYQDQTYAPGEMIPDDPNKPVRQSRAGRARGDLIIEDGKVVSRRSTMISKDELDDRIASNTGATRLSGKTAADLKMHDSIYNDPYAEEEEEQVEPVDSKGAVYNDPYAEDDDGAFPSGMSAAGVAVLQDQRRIYMNHDAELLAELDAQEAAGYTNNLYDESSDGGADLVGPTPIVVTGKKKIDKKDKSKKKNDASANAVYFDPYAEEDAEANGDDDEDARYGIMKTAPLNAIGNSGSRNPRKKELEKEKQEMSAGSVYFDPYAEEEGNLDGDEDDQFYAGMKTSYLSSKQETGPSVDQSKVSDSVYFDPYAESGGSEEDEEEEKSPPATEKSGPPAKAVSVLGQEAKFTGRFGKGMKIGKAGEDTVRQADMRFATLLKSELKGVNKQPAITGPVDVQKQEGAKMSGQALAQLERDKRMLAGMDASDLKDMFEAKAQEEEPSAKGKGDKKDKRRLSKTEDKRKRRFSFGKAKEEDELEDGIMGMYNNPYAE